MKKSYLIYFVFLLIAGSVFLSCTKENIEDQPPAAGDFTKYLEIDEIKRAYYDSYQRRYETNEFSIDNSIFKYLITIEAGVKYRVMLYGNYMGSVDLKLLSLNNDTVLIGEQANVGHTAEYFLWDAQKNDTLVIEISANDPSVYNQPYYLSFEEIGTYQLNWKGYNWLCDGDWEVNSDDQLVYFGYKSGFTKWAKLLDQNITSYHVELEFFSKDGFLDNFIGMAVYASDNIFYMINLPEISTQFKINGINAWELWGINMGNKGIGREIGNFENSFLAGKNILSAFVNVDSLSFLVNQEVAIEGPVNSNFYNGFYITYEDFDSDSTRFTNISFEQY